MVLRVLVFLIGVFEEINLSSSRIRRRYVSMGGRGKRGRVRKGEGKGGECF